MESILLKWSFLKDSRFLGRVTLSLKLLLEFGWLKAGKFFANLDHRCLDSKILCASLWSFKWIGVEAWCLFTLTHTYTQCKNLIFRWASHSDAIVLKTHWRRIQYWSLANWRLKSFLRVLITVVWIRWSLMWIDVLH